MQTELSQFTTIIGMDWADKKHDVCVQATETRQRKSYQIQHKADKIDEWARSLYRRYGGPIAVALELSKGPIVSALQKYDFFVIFPIDPTTLTNYRKAFTPSGAKDDPTDAELALDLLLCHPNRFQALKPQSVEMRTLMTLVEQRATAIKAAMPLTTGEAVIVPYRLQVLTLVAQLEVALASIRRYDDEIASLAPQHTDYGLFDCLPGAGPSLAPRLLVAFGEQRERFTSAAEVQKYSGIAPVTQRSGQTTWIHWRWQCPTFLRQTFVEWAAQTINKSYWAGLYYYQQRAKGCSHQAAVRALAFKWIRILYRCWVTSTPYDEAKYLKALQERGSPLLKIAEAA